MVKILEFNDLDIPNEILPKPDFDVPADLLVFMRNDPMFYRKNFFPAVEEYRKNKKNTKPLENMINRGFDQYCTKFNIQNPKKEIFNIGDVKRLIAEIIADEMKELDEGKVNEFIDLSQIIPAMRRAFTGDAQAKAWYNLYQKDPKKAEDMVGREVHRKYMKQYIGST